MEKIIWILLLFSCFHSNAQPNTTAVSYQFTYVVGGKPVNSKSILRCSGSLSMFQYSSDFNQDNKVQTNDDGSLSVNLKSADSYYLFDLNNKKLTFTDDIDDKIYKINENFLAMRWVLSNQKEETRKINGFMCNRATLNFRGRNYIAWYAPKLPLPFGPWKFNGLPGLILEIYDTENSYHWSATKIVYPSKEKVDFGVIDKLKAKEIPLREFVEKYENALKRKQEAMLARLPRGFKVENTSLVRASVELIYEWETRKATEN